MVKQSQIKAERMNIYYLEPGLMSSIERVMVNSRVELRLVTRDWVDKWAVLKMNNLKEFVLSYYWKGTTYELPGLDSYICHLRKSKSSMGRFLVTIPTHEDLEEGYNQFLIDFKFRRVFEVESSFKVAEHSVNEMSR
jgi:hypothetical protein